MDGCGETCQPTPNSQRPHCHRGPPGRAGPSSARRPGPQQAPPPPRWACGWSAAFPGTPCSPARADLSAECGRGGPASPHSGDGPAHTGRRPRQGPGSAHGAPCLPGANTQECLRHSRCPGVTANDGAHLSPGPGQPSPLGPQRLGLQPLCLSPSSVKRRSDSAHLRGLLCN